MAKLPRSFYDRDASLVAPDLLGCTLVYQNDGALLKGRIVEVEAYRGADDPGSHAFRGETPRNRVMFGPPGHAYVYRSYGIHACLNVVCEPEGKAGAVLLRAVEPIAGVKHMVKRRGGRPLSELCNGPGKLCQAFGITLALNGTDLEGGALWVEDGARKEPVQVSERIGLTKGADLPLRFFLEGNLFLSRRPAASAAAFVDR